MDKINKLLSRISLMLEGIHESKYRPMIEGITHRRKLLSECVYQLCQGEVQHGVFKGMKLLNKGMWGDSDIGGKLLGIYEDELHGCLRRFLDFKPDLIVNYGCAEGFYGIGMARLLPNTKVVMIDIDENCLNIAKENAELNNLQNVEFNATCNNLEYFEFLLASSEHPLIIMDCEGYEHLMLDPINVPSLNKASIIVEMHDCIYDGLTEQVANRFTASHSLEVITQGTKNLHIEPITWLSDLDKFLIANENRPCTMHWLEITPISMI